MTSATDPQRRALVVDDLEMIRAFVGAVLADAGFNVTVAENGRKAVEALHGDDYALIITDVLMPEQDGLGFLLEARRILAGREHAPKVIAMSGGGQYATARFYLEPAQVLGVSETLVKPFTVEELLAAVTRVGLDH